MNALRTRWWWALTVLALLAVVPFTEYRDLFLTTFVANLVAYGHWNVYQYLSTHPAYEHIHSIMPPLYYLAYGGYLALLRLVHLDPLPQRPVPLLSIHHFLYPPVPFPLFGHLYGPAVWAGLILLKLPYLAVLFIGAAGMARLAGRLGVNPQMARWWWIASPIVWMASFIQGQLDIVPAVVTVWALVVWSPKKPWGTLALLGLAACFKDYALILVPVTAVYLGRPHLGRIVAYAAVGTAPFVAVALPYLGHAFVSRALLMKFSGGLLSEVQLSVRPVHLWAVAYGALLVLAWFAARRSEDRAGEDRADDPRFMLLVLWVLTLGSIFILGYWLPNFVVWLVPFTTLLAVRSGRYAIGWVLANELFLLDNFLTYAHNLDGSVLQPIFHAAPVVALSTLATERGVDFVYTLSWVALAVVIGWAWWERQDAHPTPPPWSGLWASWLLMGGYLAIMVAQHV